MLKLKSQLCKIDKNIGFAHVIPDTLVFDDNSLTKYGLQLLGSPLSYQLTPIDINFSILSNLDNLPTLYDNTMEQDFPESLPVTTLDWDFNICEHGSVSKHEFFQKLKVTHTESQSIEKRTRKQRESKEWKEYRKNRLTSTSAHKILIRKKIFDTIYNQLDKPFNEQIESVKQALYHGIRNEALANEKYQFIMNYKINRPVKIREAGIIIQSQLFWLGASPDGVIFDKKIQEIGLLEIKCPYNKRNLSIESIITDKTFYIALSKDKKPYLKKEHHFGYYTQIQVAMGLAGLKWCQFVVYVYSGMIIVKVDFDRDYFQSVIDKINHYYKDYYINELLSRANSE